MGRRRDPPAAAATCSRSCARSGADPHAGAARRAQPARRRTPARPTTRRLGHAARAARRRSRTPALPSCWPRDSGPTPPSVIVYFADTGVHYTADGGATWTRCRSTGAVLRDALLPAGNPDGRQRHPRLLPSRRRLPLPAGPRDGDHLRPLQAEPRILVHGLGLARPPRTPRPSHPPPPPPPPPAPDPPGPNSAPVPPCTTPPSP